MTASEGRLACGPETEHTAVLGEDPLLVHVGDYLTLGRPIHTREDVVEPPSPIAVRDAAFLEDQGHHLLREDVSR